MKKGKVEYKVNFNDKTKKLQWLELKEIPNEKIKNFEEELKIRIQRRSRNLNN